MESDAQVACNATETAGTNLRGCHSGARTLTRLAACDLRARSVREQRDDRGRRARPPPGLRAFASSGRPPSNEWARLNTPKGSICNNCRSICSSICS